MRVYANGRKVYVVQSRGPRGPKRVTLGRHGELSCEEARKRAAPVIDAIKRGEERTPVRAPTVADLADRFMSEYVGTHCKPGTAPKYRSVLENHVLPALGPMKLEDVGRAEVTALHHRLRETPGMANTVVDVLSRCSGWPRPGTWRRRGEPVPAGAPLPDAPARAVPDAGEYRRLGHALGEAEGTLWPLRWRRYGFSC